MSVVFVPHNLYKEGKARRDIMLNLQYLVFLKDVGQIEVLVRGSELSALSPLQK